MTYIADIDSLVTDNGVQVGHYRAVASLYTRILGSSCRVAGGPVYADIVGYLKLPFCAKRTGLRFVNKIKNLVNLFALFVKTGRSDEIVFQSQAPAIILLGIILFARKQRVYMIYYEKLAGRVRRYLWRIAKRKIAGVICPNEGVGESYGTRYQVVTDYIYAPVNQSNLGEAKYKYMFATVGILSKDKGVFEAIEKIGPSGYSYLVAGRAVNDEDRMRLEELARPFPNIKLKIGFVRDEDYARYIRESRCGLLNYSDAYSNHSSGVIFDFLFKGRPIFGRRCETLKLIEAHGLGVVYDDLKTVDVDEAVGRLMSKQTEASIEKYLSLNAAQGESLKEFIKGDQ